MALLGWGGRQKAEPFMTSSCGRGRHPAAIGSDSRRRLPPRSVLFPIAKADNVCILQPNIRWQRYRLSPA